MHLVVFGSVSFYFFGLLCVRVTPPLICYSISPPLFKGMQNYLDVKVFEVVWWLCVKIKLKFSCFIWCSWEKFGLWIWESFLWISSASSQKRSEWLIHELNSSVHFISSNELPWWCFYGSFVSFWKFEGPFIVISWKRATSVAFFSCCVPWKIPSFWVTDDRVLIFPYEVWIQSAFKCKHLIFFFYCSCSTFVVWWAERCLTLLSYSTHKQWVIYESCHKLSFALCSRTQIRQMVSTPRQDIWNGWKLISPIDLSLCRERPILSLLQSVTSNVSFFPHIQNRSLILLRQQK